MEDGEDDKKKAGDELWRSLFGEEPPGEAEEDHGVLVRERAEGVVGGQPYDHDSEEMMLDGEECGEEPGRVCDDDGGAIMRSLGDPRLPSEKEVGEHNLAHLPCGIGVLAAYGGAART